MRSKDTAYIVERLALRFMSMMADYERRLAEHRASFGARTSADAKIIEGLRRELIADRNEAWTERDGLLTQVQDQRAEIERLQWENKTMHKDAEDGYAEVWWSRPPAIVGLLSERDKMRAEVAAFRAEVADLRGTLDMVHASLRIKPGDHIGEAIEALKSLSPKYKVGDKLESYNRSLGLAIPVTVVGVRTVYDCQGDGAEYPVGHSESELKARYADHDTPAGKEAAEAAAEIKVDDVVEVVSASSCATFSTDIGRRGKVTYIGEKTIDVEGVPGYACPAGGVVSKRDVRKVTQ